MLAIILATDKSSDNTGTPDTQPDFVDWQNNIKMMTDFDGRQTELDAR